MKWRKVQTAAARYDALFDSMFASSITHWAQSAIVENFKEFEGNCSEQLSLNGNSILHVHGDVDSTITASHGSTEIILGGCLRPSGLIVGRDLVSASVLVGGDILGRAELEGGAILICGGALCGRVVAGNPMTKIVVEGDCRGEIASSGGGILFLDVRGYMPRGRVEALGQAGFTLVTASITQSDGPSGFFHQGNTQWFVESAN